MHNEPCKEVIVAEIPEIFVLTGISYSISVCKAEKMESYSNGIFRNSDPSEKLISNLKSAPSKT